MVDFDGGLLNQWLRVNGCRHYDTSAPGAVLTHLLLSGGRLVVPDSLHSQMLIEMTRCHARGDAMYIVEMPTLEGYKLHCEIDMCLARRAITTREFCEHVLPVMQEVLARIFPQADTTAVLCETTPKTVKSKDPEDPPGTMYTKTGIHIVWPRLIVTRETAWAARAMLLIGLKSLRLPPEWFPEDEAQVKPHHKAFLPQGGWEETLDKAVFDKNGLRTIWSRKASVCRECCNAGLKGDKPALFGGSGGSCTAQLKGLGLERVYVCSKCCNTGKVDEGRPYVPVLQVNHAAPGTASETCKAPVDITGMDMYDQMLLCSIRVVPRIGKPGFTATLSELRLTPAERAMASGFSQFQQSECRPRATKRKMRENGLAGDAAVEYNGTAPSAGKKHKTSRRLVPIAPTGPVWDYIAQYIADSTGCRAVNAKTNEPPAPRAMYAVTTTSHHCANKRGEHGSSTAWYLFLPNGVHQRCWSHKTPGGSTIACDCFQGPALPYPDPVAARKLLFPDLPLYQTMAATAPILDVATLPIMQQQHLVYKEDEKCRAEAGMLPTDLAMELAAKSAKPRPRFRR